MTVLLCLVFVILYVCNVQSSSNTCENKGKNYTKCDLMFWTGWNTCTGGHGLKPTECAVGNEKRQKAICCPRTALNETTDETFRHCKADCNMKDDDFEVVRRLPTTGTTVGPLHTASNGIMVDTTVHSRLSNLKIAGIAASGAVALLAICCLVFGLLYKWQKRKTEVKPEGKRNDVSAS